MILHIDRDPALVDRIAWQGSLQDRDGLTLATYAGPDAYSLLLTAAGDVDRYVATHCSDCGTVQEPYRLDSSGRCDACRP